MEAIIGYRYYIVEMFPDEDNNDLIQHILVYDTLESAQEVLDVMNKHNFTMSCYYILLEPIYREEEMADEKQEFENENGFWSEFYWHEKKSPKAGLQAREPGWEQVEEELPDPPF